MSNIPPNDNLYVPRVHYRSRPPSPSPSSADAEEGLFFPPMNEQPDSRPYQLADITFNNLLARQQQQQQPPTAAELQQPPLPVAAAAAAAPTPTIIMPTVEEQLEQFRQLATKQQEQIDAQNNQMAALAEQHRQSQQSVAQLSAALQSLTTMTSRPEPPKKKPDIPPFDKNNILIWIRRLNAAYERQSITLPKDKFSFLESTFDIALNPKINAFLYGDNTEDSWNQFIAYLKEEYGPTRRQKAMKLIKEIPRQGLKPSQFMAQINEDTEGVTVDDIKKEHLLKSLPPRIREYLGRDADTKTADQIAAWADNFFDRQGNPIEKSLNTVNNVNPSNHSSSSSSSSSFTPAFSDEEVDDINAIRRGQAAGRGRFSRSRSRVNGSSNQRPSSAAKGGQRGRSPSASRSQPIVNGLCWFHTKWGNDAQKCAEGCKHFNKNANQGNAKGGRRQ